MTDFTRHFNLPYLMSQQAQKHVTVNESLEVLDSVVQLAIVSKTEPEPLEGAVDGHRYIVPSGATGEFTGQDGQLAWREEGVWRFLTPAEGWIAWVSDTQRIEVLMASGWVPLESGFDKIGIHAEPDNSNRLAVASDSALFTHDGTDHRLKVNRAGSADTASVLFQTDFTGAAEFGLSGAAGFALRTSPDGSAWQTRLDCPDDSVGIRTAALRAGTFSLESDSVESIAVPETSGIFLIWNYNGTFPNVNHSAIFVFDAGPTPALVPVFVGSAALSYDTTVLTGTTGGVNQTNIAVQADEILVENRRSAPMIYRYVFLA